MTQAFTPPITTTLTKLIGDKCYSCDCPITDHIISWIDMSTLEVGPCNANVIYNAPGYCNCGRFDHDPWDGVWPHD